MTEAHRPSSDRKMVLELCEALDEHDVDLGSTPLHQYVDPEALERVVNSLDDDFEITFTVEATSVTVTPKGVHTQRRE
ncbi:HalOD1 output domain-containing protein [Haloplanus salinarum]|uniref:HalOD1 output domain-containing protein n=1 Tax=Haloplanus salinarum TaxID=1912324 RepID=UPI00214B45DF|nr:HalOD1 output domain-containing protein [Haloplanus salinarum]